jgi:hypothetical protein
VTVVCIVLSSSSSSSLLKWLFPYGCVLLLLSPPTISVVNEYFINISSEESAQRATSFKSQADTYKQQLLTLKTEQAQLEVTLRSQQGIYMGD